MKKRILSLLLVLVFVFSSLLFVACGQKQVVNENPVEQAHSEEVQEPSQGPQQAESVASTTDGFIKISGGGHDPLFTTPEKEGSDLVINSQSGNQATLTGTVKGYAEKSNNVDVISLSNTKTAYNFHHYVDLTLTSELREGDSIAKIAAISLWSEILDDEGEETGNFAWDDGDDEYSKPEVSFTLANATAQVLTVDVDEVKTLKVKVTFADEAETEKEYSIDFSALQLGSRDNISKVSNSELQAAPSTDNAVVLKSYDSEDEVWVDVVNEKSAVNARPYSIAQYGKEFIVDTPVSGYIPYYSQASSEFDAGYIVVLRFDAQDRLAANAKSVYSVSGGDAKVYSNIDLEKLYETVYEEADEDWESNETYQNSYFYLVWRMDLNNTAPLKVKVTWADYAVEQEYTISLATGVKFQEHDDGITSITSVSSSTANLNRFGKTGKYVLGSGIDAYDFTDSYAQTDATKKINVEQYDTVLSVVPENGMDAYSIWQSEHVGYGAELKFQYVGKDAAEFEFGEKFQVKEDGKVIYSWDAEEEVVHSEYTIFDSTGEAAASAQNLVGTDYFTYFPVFQAYDDSHTVEVTWFDGCTVSYKVTLEKSASSDVLGQYYDWNSIFAQHTLDQTIFAGTKEFKDAKAAELDPEMEVLTSTAFTNGSYSQYGQVINITGAKLEKFDFTDVELEDGYYIVINIEAPANKQVQVPEQTKIQLDGKDANIVKDTAQGYNYLLIKLSSANETHKVSVQWNSDVVAQEYTINFVNNYFLAVEE